VTTSWTDPAFELETEAVELVAKRIRTRVVEHLADSIERDLRAGTKRVADGDDLELVEQLLEEVETAAISLRLAAEDLKNAGRVMPANRTKQAELHARALLNTVRGVEA